MARSEINMDKEKDGKKGGFSVVPPVKEAAPVPAVPEKKSMAILALVPKTVDELIRLSELLSKSSFVPDTYRNKHGDCFAAIQMGLELGLQPMQSLQNIAVINGRPAVWGDALLALAMNSPNCEFIRETFDDETMVATCSAKRRGHEVLVRTFSKADAVQAGLWQKPKTPWCKYPKRMLGQRARGFALRDAFPDVLRGMITREEASDYEVTEPTRPAPPPRTTQQKRETPPVKDADYVEVKKDKESAIQSDSKKDSKSDNGAPDLGDFLNGLLRCKTADDLSTYEQEFAPIWKTLYKDGTPENKKIENVLARQKTKLN